MEARVLLSTKTENPWRVALKLNWPPTLPATSPAQGEVEGGACGARARPRGPRPKIALFWVAELNFEARDLGASPTIDPIS